MKFRKALSGILALSIVIPSFNLKSVANSNILDRYQTLEGEYITIDSSAEGELHEIEIFGNTVQDENNLEDIQSVGDLYVGENGNPILDNKGREQYTFEIASIGKNLFNLQGDQYHTRTHAKIESNTGGLVVNENVLQLEINSVYTYVPAIKTSLKKSHAYTISFDCVGQLISDRMFIDLLDKDFNVITRVFDGLIVSAGKNYSFSITLNENIEYIKFAVADDDVDSKGGRDDWYIDLSNIQIEEGYIVTEYAQYEESKTTILLPTQLQKVGNVADRLYWDNEKGRYIIEKNIDSFTLGEIKPFEVETYGGGADYWTHIWTDIGIERGYRRQSKIITNYNTTDKNTTYLMYWTHQLRLLTRPWVIKEGATSAREISADEYMEYANANNIYKEDTIVMIIKETPSLIETNITSKIKIPTYDKKTHLYVETENRINPTLKVTVDRINQIAQEAVRKAENESTIHNVSTARNIVNQMDESILKDQLQERLNNLFSLDDMQLERKTASSNIDVYIKCDNMLSLSLSTNSITFENFGGTEDLEKVNAVELTINSSLPYEVNAYLPQEMQNNDKTVVLDKDILNIKANSEIDYNKFADIDTKLQLLDNQPANNNVIHGIDIMLKGGIAHKKDAYKGTIKFEVVQK